MRVRRVHEFLRLRLQKEFAGEGVSSIGPGMSDFESVHTGRPLSHRRALQRVRAMRYQAHSTWPFRLTHTRTVLLRSF